MRDSIKKLLAVCALGFTVTAFSGAALARTPGPGGPGVPQVQQQHQQIAHSRHFRPGPPAHARRYYQRQRFYGHGRHGRRHGYHRSYRAPRYHSGFNLVLQFGDRDRRSSGGRGGGGGGHRR